MRRRRTDKITTGNVFTAADFEPGNWSPFSPEVVKLEDIPGFDDEGRAAQVEPPTATEVEGPEPPTEAQPDKHDSFIPYFFNATPALPTLTEDDPELRSPVLVRLRGKRGEVGGVKDKY